MCDLFSAGIATTAIGAIGGAFSSYMQISAANAASETQARIADRNAKMAEYEAQDIKERGDIEAKQQRLRTAQMKGSQMASLAGAGVDISDGSALDVLTDTAYFGEVDRLTILSNAERDAWAKRNQVANYQMQAGLARSQRTSPWLGAGTSLLSSASSLGQAYLSKRM